MRPAKLTCEYAAYDRNMIIQCAKTGEGCAHQKWCQMTGWSKLTERADTCPARRDDSNGKAKAVKKRRNKV